MTGCECVNEPVSECRCVEIGRMQMARQILQSIKDLRADWFNMDHKEMGPDLRSATDAILLEIRKTIDTSEAGDDV